MATKPKRIEDMSEAELTRRSGEQYDKIMPSPEPGEQGPRKTTTKMRSPTASEVLAIERGRSQNRLAKDYEDIKDPKTLTDHIRKNVMPDRLRKEADKNFQNLPEEVRDYEAYKDAGYKKGGKVNSASARADGIAQRGKTRGRVL